MNIYIIKWKFHAIPPNVQGAEVWFESITYPPSEEKYPIRTNGGIW
ncbi:hypothetical protein [Shimazuella kribbensis]|nr:hypothetical protein [Shimazuella kribbensis]